MTVMTTTTTICNPGRLIEIMGCKIKLLQLLLGATIKTSFRLLFGIHLLSDLTPTMIIVPVDGPYNSLVSYFLDTLISRNLLIQSSSATPSHALAYNTLVKLLNNSSASCISVPQSLCSSLVEHLSVPLSHVASQLKATVELTHTFSLPETFPSPNGKILAI